MEKVAHGVYKDSSRFFPVDWILQCMFMSGEFETVSVIALPHGEQTLRHTLRITMFTSMANLRTTRQRVPCGLSPLDTGMV